MPTSTTPISNLTEDEFNEQFTVVPDALGDQLRSSMPGTDPDSRHLWTIVEADGDLYAVPGVHYVNRIGYLLTEEPWLDHIHSAEWDVRDDDDGTEDD